MATHLGIPAPAAVGVEARLAHIESMLEELHSHLQEVQPLAAMAVDIADEAAAEALSRGVDPALRLRELTRLLEAISEPSTVRTLQGIISRVDRVEPLLELVDQVPGLIAMSVDIFDEAMGKAIARGFDVQGAVHAGTKGFLRLGQFVLSEEFSSVLTSGLLDPKAVSLVGRVGRALADIAQEDVHTPGVVGLVRAAAQEDVRRAANFGLRFGARFGQLLRNQLAG